MVLRPSIHIPLIHPIPIPTSSSTTLASPIVMSLIVLHLLIVSLKDMMTIGVTLWSDGSLWSRFFQSDDLLVENVLVVMHAAWFSFISFKSPNKTFCVACIDTWFSFSSLLKSPTKALWVACIDNWLFLSSVLKSAIMLDIKLANSSPGTGLLVPTPLSTP